MKASKILLVLAIALAVVTIAVPAGAWFGPFGGCGFGVPFGIGACGFGFPLGVGCGGSFQSSFVATSSFSTVGGAGFGCGIPFGGCAVPFGVGGCGLGWGTGFGTPFGFC